MTNDNGATNNDTNDYFGMELNYNTDAGVSNTLYYNGNVSAVKWKNAGAVSGATGQKSYAFAYDKTDKLVSATFQKYGTSAWNAEQGAWNEAMTYDHNGNVLTLQRNQNQHSLTGTTVNSTATPIDNLTYTYASANQLSKVTDGATSAGFNDAANQATEYTYDTHGNLTSDVNKGISAITYNALGKAQQITFSNGDVVTYTYDGGGNKLTMVSTVSGTATTTNYVNSFVYNTAGTTSTLNFFSSPEGRVVKNSKGNLEYQYAITDHQGNTRVVFSSAPAASQPTLADFDGDVNDQQSQFQNVPTPVPYSAANHTPGGSKVVRLNQATPVGPAFNKKVFPGDKVDMEVWSYYESTTGYGTATAAIATMISSVTTALVAGGPDYGGLKSTGVNSALSNFGTGANLGDTRPAAFLNYILFDQNYAVVDAGWQVVPAGSFSKQYLNMPTITVKEAGYIFVYLSYEDQSNNYVYFDDFKVSVTPTNIVQSTDYYPFGLQHSTSWTRDNATNNFLYDGGSELNTTTSLYDLPYRNYDPTLGRFFQVDPLAHVDHNLTPYHYSRNNPLGFSDPSGALEEEGMMDDGGWDGWSNDGGSNEGGGADEGGGRTAQEQELRDAVDTNGDGKISQAEVDAANTALQGTGLSISYTQAESDEIGVSGSGTNNGGGLAGTGYGGSFASATGGSSSGDNFGFFSWFPGGSNFSRTNMGQDLSNINWQQTGNNVKTTGEAAGYGSVAVAAYQLKVLKQTTGAVSILKYGLLMSAGKFLGGVGNLGTAVGVVIDYSAMQSGEISGNRFVYRATSTGVSLATTIGVGTAYGGPWGTLGGALVGGALTAGELTYDAWNSISPMISKGLSDFQNWTPGGR